MVPKEITDLYAKTRAYITEGYGVPEKDIEDTRRLGICLHHSYIPSVPMRDRNYAEIFNDFHFGRLDGWHRQNGVWIHDEGGTLFGLRYDFVVTWDRRASGRRGGEGSNTIVKYWTSMRWILQLTGGHAVNKKGEHWRVINAKKVGGINFKKNEQQYELIKPNRELVSICIVGNYDRFSPPAQVWPVIREIAEKTGVQHNIFFHRDFDYKTCPGAKIDKVTFSEAVFGNKDGIFNHGSESATE